MVLALNSFAHVYFTFDIILCALLFLLRKVYIALHVGNMGNQGGHHHHVVIVWLPTASMWIS